MFVIESLGHPGLYWSTEAYGWVNIENASVGTYLAMRDIVDDLHEKGHKEQMVITPTHY